MSRRKDRKKWGVFSRHSDRDKEISERDEDDPRQDIHTHPLTTLGESSHPKTPGTLNAATHEA